MVPLPVKASKIVVDIETTDFAVKKEHFKEALYTEC